MCPVPLPSASLPLLVPVPADENSFFSSTVRGQRRGKKLPVAALIVYSFPLRTIFFITYFYFGRFCRTLIVLSKLQYVIAAKTENAATTT